MHINIQSLSTETFSGRRDFSRDITAAVPRTKYSREISFPSGYTKKVCIFYNKLENRTNHKNS